MAAAITGVGAISSIGANVAETRDALFEGRDGIRPVRRFSTAPFGVELAAMVPGFDDRPDDDDGALATELGIRAGREALEASRLSTDLPRDRIGLVLGSSLARRGDDVEEGGLHRIAEDIARALDVRGPTLTVSTACASSTNAVGLAKDLLDLGVVDAVVTGGVDTLTQDIYAGFHVLGLLSKEKCSPFSGAPGTTLGEGAGMIVLERADSAIARGARVWSTVLGYGLSSDAHHVTTPDPNGAGVARAIRGALEDAGITPDEVDYVNAHGTGTLANDSAEWRAIEAALGARAASIPVSSTKGHLGHAQGAAGILELIASLVTLERGALPPTLRCDAPRPRTPPDPVRGERPRPATVRAAVSTNSAFGGANAAIAFDAPRRPLRAAVQRARRDVYWIGGGAIGGFSPKAPTGRAAELLGDDATRALVGRCPTFDVERLAASADPRALDRSATLLVAATGAALAESSHVVKGAARERTGLFVASARVSPESGDAFDRSVDERGPGRASATAFSRLVVNAPAGACAKLFSLRGPTTTLLAGRGGSLFAVAHAAAWLARRRDADVIVAAAIDEVEEIAVERALEASVALVLSEAPRAGAVRVSGVGVAAPRAGSLALFIAAREAGVETGRIAIARSPSTERAFVCAPALALLHAREAILSGRARHVAVVSEESDSVAVAIVLSAV